MNIVARGQPVPSICLRNPERHRPAAARLEWLFLRKGDGAALNARRSCRIPRLSCAWDVHASSGLRRSLLPLAFDLEKSSDLARRLRLAFSTLGAVPFEEAVLVRVCCG